MQFDDLQLKQLMKALIHAYPTRSALEEMVSHGLDVQLSTITSEGNLDHTVFELLRWAQAHGTVDKLVQAALSHNSQNPELLRVAEQLGMHYGQTSSKGLDGMNSILA